MKKDERVGALRRAEWTALCVALASATALCACVKKKESSEAKSIRTASGRILVDEIVMTDALPSVGTAQGNTGQGNAAAGGNTAAGNTAAGNTGAPLGLDEALPEGDPIQGPALLLGKSSVSLCFLEMAEIPGVDPDSEQGRPVYLAKASQSLAQGDTSVLANAWPVTLTDIEAELRNIPGIAPKLEKSQTGMATRTSELATEVGQREGGPNYGAALGVAAGIGIVGYNWHQSSRLGADANKHAEELLTKLKKKKRWTKLSDWDKFWKEKKIREMTFNKSNENEEFFGFYKKTFTAVKRACWGRSAANGGTRGAFLRVGTMALCVGGTATAAWAISTAANAAGLDKDRAEIPVRPVEEMIASPEFASAVQTHMQTAAISLDLEDAQFDLARDAIRKRGAQGQGQGCHEQLLASAQGQAVPPIPTNVEVAPQTGKQVPAATQGNGIETGGNGQ